MNLNQLNTIDELLDKYSAVCANETELSYICGMQCKEMGGKAQNNVLFLSCLKQEILRQDTENERISSEKMQELIDMFLEGSEEA